MRKTTKTPTTTLPTTALAPTTLARAPAPRATLTVRLLESRYGTAQPTLAIELPRGAAHHRAFRAALHRLAATIEDATPRAEGWIVQMDDGDGESRGRVYLELLHADAAEAARGMAVLDAIANTINQ